jgi:WD40 repeat protein
MDFLTMSGDGSLGLFNGSNGQLAKELRVPVTGKQYIESCVEFSPDGNHFLVTICDDKKLSTFRTNDFQETITWTRSECKSIKKARWMSNSTILAGYHDPGDLVIYSLGDASPVLKIDPKELVKCTIMDFDISRDKRHAICGSGISTKLVFKVAIDGSSNKLQWRHSGHFSRINSVRLSQNQRQVLSGGNDKRVVLASAEDGSVVCSFDGFTNQSVRGVLWCPGNERALVISVNEVVLLEVGPRTLKKLAEMEGEALGLDWIYGLNAFFGEEEGSSLGRGPFLILGGDEGKIVRIRLE